MRESHALITPRIPKPLDESKLGQLWNRCRAAARKSDLTNDDLQDLNESTGKILEDNFVGALKKTLAKVRRLAKIVLDKVTSVIIPKLPALDVAKAFPKEWQESGLKCYWWSNFEEHFGHHRERATKKDIKLVVHRLLKGLSNEAIVKALGGEAVAESFLGQMAYLIAFQPHGEEDGVLLVNGWANIFFIKDDNGELWAVYCAWISDDREWHLNAIPISDPVGWRAGRQVFSSDSLAA